MNQSKFNNLISLVEIDKEISQFNCEQANLINQIETLELELEDIQRHIEFKYRNLLESKKKSLEIEAQLKGTEELIKEINNKINKSKNTKEYYYLENELECIIKKKEQFEILLFELWQKIDKEKIVYENEIKKAEKKRIDLEKEIKNYQLKNDYLEQEIITLNIKRKNIEAKIELDLLKLYNSMRENVQDPVVKIKVDSCSACFYQITLQDLNTAKENNLIKCKNCYRLLYIKQ